MNARTNLLVVAACATLAACGGHAVSATPAYSNALRPATATPPPCPGQHTNKKYGDKSTTLKTRGGALCVPSFGGFGGKVQYPGVERSVKLTVRTSTSNVYDEPSLGSGTPLVYLNLHFHAGTHFGTAFPDKGGLTAAALQSGDTYTAFGIVTVGHLALMFSPCYAVATSGPYGGVFPNLGALVSDATITGAGFGVIELYAGEQSTSECTAGSHANPPRRQALRAHS